MTRKILHLDLDAFYCAVEEQHNPSLAGKPFAVGGRPEERGVISSCSYAARHLGVHSAMPMAIAVRLCPQLIIVSPKYSLYSQYSQQVMDKLHEITPLVEQISIDEAFLDVSELAAPGRQIAKKIQSVINEELGLPCSIGVATNKLLAKTANDVGKASVNGISPPNAVTIVPPGEEEAFLAPLPVRALWGVGPKTAERLSELKISNIGEIAKFPETKLVKIFGKNGSDLSRRAKGVDKRPIVTFHEPKSISREITFARDSRDPDELHKTLLSLSAGVGKRLRKVGYCGVTVKLKLRWADFTTLTRQKSFEAPTDQDEQIFLAAYNLFEKVWKRGRYVRLVGVGVSGLQSSNRQLSLWDHDAVNSPDQSDRLRKVVDELRDRFGKNIIRKASELETPEEVD